MKRLLRCFLIWMVALYGSPVAFSNQPDYAIPANIAAQSPASHIALLLPLDAPALKHAALALQMGFFAAARQESLQPFDIRVYATAGKAQDILEAYQQAIHDGAMMVVGPLTRNGVNVLTLSHLVTVPTLTLNFSTIEDIDPPAHLYLFGLNTAAEAEHIAQLAATSNKNHAVIIADRSDLSKRLKAAFADAWIKPDNTTSAEEVEIISHDKLAQLSRYTLDSNNIVFLALNGTSSRAVRLFIRHSTPVYATSLVFTGSNDPTYFQELDAVKFTDMPWILEPEHPLVKKYHHPDMPTDISLQRFYALGIDAFRLALSMTQTHSPESIMLDGVTGKISFEPPNRFTRRQLPAVFRQGKVIPEY